MPHQTPLYAVHVDAGARMVDFAGWSMPLHYGSQIAEHEAVRSHAGLFDVSHMAVTDLAGEGARAMLRELLANDVAKLDGRPGRALYSCLLNEQGGVIDDLIVYARGEERGYRIISNAATRERVLPYLLDEAQRRGLDAAARDELAMIAVQGPQAPALLEAVYGAAAEPALALRPFQSTELEAAFIGRTGYTGEDGFEIVLPAQRSAELWHRLHEAGGTPCGLGARDSLRLEAGLNLNGHEMDEQTSPLAAGLDWTVAWEPAERDFVGRQALEAQREQGPQQRLIGLVVEGRAPAREGYTVRTDAGEGVITSGGYAPSVGAPVALARVPAAASGGYRVVIRNREVPARAVQPPFVRHGKVRV